MWVGLISLVSACQVTKCFKELLFLKEDFWNSRRFLVHTSVKYRDYKVRQRRITKGDKFKGYKVREVLEYKVWQKFLKTGLQKCNEITKWDKLGLQIATGLQRATDYKAIQFDTCYRTSKLKGNNQTVIQSMLSSKLFSYLYT